MMRRVDTDTVVISSLDFTGIDIRTTLDEARRMLLDGADADALYRRWFHRETGARVSWPSLAAYRTALLDPGRFEPGWRVVRAAPHPVGALIAMRGGRERIVAPPEMAPDHPGALSPGAGATLRVHPLMSGESGGFWHVWSVGWQCAAPSRMRRVYLNIAADHVRTFVARHVAGLPARPIWAMKFLCGTHDAGRHDSALLYLPAQADIGTSWVSVLLDTAAPLCEDRLPPFVARISPGLGLAPDPGGERSFGQALCAAVADMIGCADDADRFASEAIVAIRAIPGMQMYAPSEVGS